MLMIFRHELKVADLFCKAIVAKEDVRKGSVIHCGRNCMRLAPFALSEKLMYVFSFGTIESASSAI